MQLKAQEDARKASIAPSILGGLATAFVGSDAFSSLFAGAADPAADPAGGSTSGLMSFLQGFFGGR